MSKARVFKKNDGSIRIAHYVVGSKTTEAEFYAKVNPEGDEFEDIDKSEIPSDRTDRNAWELGSDKKIKVNAVKKAELDKAKQYKIDEKEALDELIKEKVDSKKQV